MTNILKINEIAATTQVDLSIKHMGEVAVGRVVWTRSTVQVPFNHTGKVIT